jgi:predicted DNA-binding transcriptional regulator AlpA
MTLHRWIADERLNFPSPHYFGRFRFWKLAELEAWEEARPRRRAA